MPDKPLSSLKNFGSATLKGRNRADIAKNARTTQCLRSSSPVWLKGQDVARKLLKSWVLLIAAGALAMPEAQATGNLSCSIDDANLALVLFASTNRDHGTIVGITEGTLTLKAGPLAKIGREFKLEGEHVIQQWFLQRELRIAINVENDNGSLLLAITGRSSPSQERYSGRYSLKVSFPDGGTRTATGRIKGCNAEG